MAAAARPAQTAAISTSVCEYGEGCTREGQSFWMKLVPNSGLYERSPLCDLHNLMLIDTPSPSWIRVRRSSFLLSLDSQIILPPASVPLPAELLPQRISEEEEVEVKPFIMEEEPITESEGEDDSGSESKSEAEKGAKTTRKRKIAKFSMKKRANQHNPQKARSLLMPRSNSSMHKRIKHAKVPRHSNLERILEKCQQLTEETQLKVLACLKKPISVPLDRQMSLSECVHEHIECTNNELKHKGWTLKGNFPKLGRKQMGELVQHWWAEFPAEIKDDAQRIADLSAHYLAAMECKRALKRRRDMRRARGELFKDEQEYARPPHSVARAMHQKQRNNLEPDPPRRGIDSRSRRAQLHDPTDTDFRPRNGTVKVALTAVPAVKMHQDVSRKRALLAGRPACEPKGGVIRMKKLLAESESEEGPEEEEEVEGFHFTATW